MLLLPSIAAKGFAGLHATQSNGQIPCALCIARDFISDIKQATC